MEANSAVPMVMPEEEAADEHPAAAKVKAICEKHGWKWYVLKKPGPRYHLTVRARSGDPMYRAISSTRGDVIKAAVNDIRRG